MSCTPHPKEGALRLQNHGDQLHAFVTLQRLGVRAVEVGLLLSEGVGRDLVGPADEAQPDDTGTVGGGGHGESVTVRTKGEGKARGVTKSSCY